MRPLTTPPPRLFDTNVRVNLSPTDGVVVNAWAPTTLDLQRVKAVRAALEPNTGDDTGHTLVETKDGDMYRVDLPYADVRRAWWAWRQHADGLAALGLQLRG